MSDSPFKQKLSAETQSSLLQLLADGGLSQREIGRQLDIAESTVRKYAKQFGVNALTTGAESDSTVVSFGRTIARQAEAIRKMRKQVNATLAVGTHQENFIKAMGRLVATEASKPLRYYPTTIAKAKRRAPLPAVDPDHTEQVTLVLSDWHLAEVVRQADANGINRYNSMICANRLWTIVEKFKRIVQMHRAMYEITKINLLVLGDLISGSIHDEFVWSNDMSDQASQIMGARLLRMVVNEILSLGIEVEVHCICGNHARTTKKLPTKNLVHTSLEWPVYEFTKMLFEGDDRVIFNVYTSQFARIDIFGHPVMIEHGIGVTNGKEEDFESDLRNILDDPVYRQATGLQGITFELAVIGDRHKPKFLERTIVNGSLIGQNELGQQWRLPPIRAQQLMWGTSRSYVRTFQYALDVTGQWNDKPENPFSEFTYEFLKDNGKYLLV